MIKQRFIFTLLFFSLLISFVNSRPLYACEQLHAKVERYATLKRKGGNATQMNRWSRQKKEASERYQECLRAQPKIYRTENKAKRSTIKPERQPRRQLSSDNPVALKLLTTCNFWIDSYNQNPNKDNKNFRDTACRALDQAEQNTPMAMDQPMQRSARECIKPGNVLDDEVHECMRGMRDADWIKSGNPK